MSFLTDLLSASAVSTGLQVSAGTGLACVIAAGTAAIGPISYTLATPATIPVPASAVSRIDWDGGGFSVLPSSAPVRSGCVPLAQVVTDASSIVAVLDMRPTSTSFLSALPYAVSSLALARSNDLTPPGLPTPSAPYRGQLIRTEGGSGVADTLWLCAKNVDNSYSWHQLDKSQNPRTPVLTAAVSSVGSIGRALRRTLSASLSPSGLLTRLASRTLPLATLSLSGSLGHVSGRLRSGALSLLGSLPQRAISRSLPASLSLSGSNQQATKRPLLAGASFTGATLRALGRVLPGATLSLLGTLTISRITLRTLTGALPFLGSLPQRTISRGLLASVSFSGSKQQAVGRPLLAGASFVGATARVLSRVLPGAGLSFLGALTVLRVALRTVTGSLSFSGSASRLAGKNTGGALSFTGTVPVRAVARLSSAGLPFSGVLARAGTRLLPSAALSFSGSLGKKSARAPAGALSFSGSIQTVHSSSAIKPLPFTLPHALGS